MDARLAHPWYSKEPVSNVELCHDDISLTSLQISADFESSKTEHESTHERTLLGQSGGNDKRVNSLKKRFSGWQLGVLSASCFAVASLIVNIAAAAWLSLHPDQDGLSEITRGNCGDAHWKGVWIHAAINAISTILLSGSNYCMQCLSAPTRRDVDIAHRKGKYLDIGVSGIRNLNSIALRKAILWWALGLSSIPLHFLYNSAFYVSLSTHNYNVYIASTDILDKTSPVYDTISSSSFRDDLLNSTQFERLNPLDCIKRYAQVFVTDRSNIVFVSANASWDAIPSVDSYAFSDAIIPRMQKYRPYDWICTSDPDIENKIVVPYIPNGRGEKQPCDSYVGRIENIVNEWSPWHSDPEYCLSQKMEETCILGGNLSIIIVVILCNAVKAAAMLYLAFGLQEPPLLTVGDAIESFLQRPDPTTKNLCLLSRSQARSRKTSPDMYLWPRDDGADKSRSWPAYTQRHKLFRAASRKRWFFTIGTIILALTIVFILLKIAINTISVSGSTIWSLGFGTLRPQAIFTGWGIDDIKSPQSQVLAAILIANLPQTLMSFLYLNLNGLLTNIWLVSEWASFDKKRKNLRVSTPRGSQRGTYFLSLPYKVAIPLNVVSGVLHWLVSQSVFLAVISEWGPDGEMIDATAIASCGFSPMAMLFVIILGSLVVIATLWVGNLEFITSMRLVGSCSAAISAACHPPLTDVNAHTKPVMWGVTRRARGWHELGHCSFTSGAVEPVENGQEYS